MNKLLCIVFSMLLAGCATETIYRDKNVPVYEVPRPPTIERPELPIHSLNPSLVISPEYVGEIAQAYVVSIRLLMNWGEANSKIVEAYRKMSEKDFRVAPVTFSSSAQPAPPSNEPTYERSENDYGTIKTFADQEFGNIVNKYKEQEQEILKDYNET